MSSSGFASSKTRSANFPFSTVPSESSLPRNFAGLMVAVCNALLQVSNMFPGDASLGAPPLSAHAFLVPLVYLVSKKFFKHQEHQEHEENPCFLVWVECAALSQQTAERAIRKAAVTQLSSS